MFIFELGCIMYEYFYLKIKLMKVIHDGCFWIINITNS